MKVARIKPYGQEYDNSNGNMGALWYLCFMSDGAVVRVSVAPTYRGAAKNRAVRAEAMRKHVERKTS